MSRWPTLLMLMLFLPWPGLVRAGEVRTADGKTYQGRVKLRDGKVVVNSPGTNDVQLDLANVRRATFTEPDARGALVESGPVQGLKVEYFVDQKMTDAKRIRLEQAVDYEWNGQPIDPAVPLHFAARFTGQITPVDTGDYRFFVVAGDGVRLWIDGKQIIDDWLVKRGERTSQPLHLIGGKACDIRLDFFNEKAEPVVRLLWATATTPKQLVPPSVLAPPPGDPLSAPPVLPEVSANGNGLRGEYFSSAELNLKNLKFIRVDPALDFDWSGSPMPGLSREQFSVRWAGRLQAPFTDTYTISVSADDGVKLWIDGRLLIDSWKLDPKERKTQVALEANKRHDLRIEYYQRGGAAFFHLFWECGRLPKQIIPMERLFPIGPATPQIKLIDPTGGGVLPPRQPVTLDASVVEAGGSVKSLDFFCDDQLLATLSSKPYQIRWEDPPQGVHTLCVRATSGSSTVAVMSSPLKVEVGEKPASGQLLTPRPINLEKFTPTTFDGSKYTMSSEGGEVYSEWDAFNFQCMPLRGDGQIIAHVVSLGPKLPAPFVLGGISLRGDLSNRSRHVSLALTNDGDSLFLRRASRSAANYNQAPTANATWLRLARQGNTITASQSTDGIKWRAVGSETVVLPDQVFVGLMMIAKGPGCSVVFDQVSVTTGRAAVFNLTAGVQTIDGSFLNGQVSGVESSGGASATVTLIRPDKRPQSIPLNQVAKLLFKSIPADLIDAAPAGQVGALLMNGDFMAGKFNGLKNGHINIDSVLFGPQSFDINNQAMAVLLRDAAMPKNTVRLSDGTLLAPASMKIADDKLQLQTALGLVSLAATQIQQIETP